VRKGIDMIEIMDFKRRKRISQENKNKKMKEKTIRKIGI